MSQPIDKSDRAINLLELRKPTLDTVTSLFDLDESQLPLLVTGIAGVAGFNAFYHFRAKYGDQVIGIRGANNWRLAGSGIEGCNIEDAETIKRLFEKHNFRTVLNCGGSCALKACELDPVMADRVNVQGILALLESVEAYNTQLIHLSIDLVYSGDGAGNHVETDPTDPVTVYGKTMVLAEQIILERRPETCILRISLPMGISFNDHAGAVDWIQARFKKGKLATLYFDEVRTPTYVECLNEVIEEVFAKRISGLFHAGGPTRISLYEIAQVVNRVGGYDPNLLIGCPRIEAGPVPPRAGNVTMNSDKIAGVLGRKPFHIWPLNEEYFPNSRDWHRDRSGWQGRPERILDELYRRPEMT